MGSVRKVNRIVDDSLKELQAHHLEIARLHIQGKSTAEIAGAMNLGVSTVRLVMHQQVYLEHLGRIRAEMEAPAMTVLARVRALAPKAVQVQEDIMRDAAASPGHRLNAAQDILDRSGDAPRQTKGEINHHHTILTVQDLADIRDVRAGRIPVDAGQSDAVDPSGGA